MNTESNLILTWVTPEHVKLFQDLLQDFLAVLLKIGTETEKLMNPIYLQMLKLLTPETENPVYPIHPYGNSQLELVRSPTSVMWKTWTSWLPGHICSHTYQGVFKSPSNITACTVSSTLAKTLTSKYTPLLNQ